MRIAIIGAGVSGLVCARALHVDHELVVYEAADYPGGHSNTIDVETESGPYAVDTGFIVYNDRNYPTFERLLRSLDVPTQPSDMSFGVSDGLSFEYNGSSAKGLFARRRHMVSTTFHRMVADLLRFNRDARVLLESDSDPSLRDWLAARGYSDAFIERLIVPQASAVWSADPRQMWSFPARFLCEFFDNHGMLEFRDRPSWRTVVGGSRAYVSALISPFRDRIRLSTPVVGVERFDDSVAVWARGAGRPEYFDAVVLATHSDQALDMLLDPSDRERELLGAIPYQRNEAVLHTDRSLLPRRRRAWASWNYHLGGDPGLPTVTYHMNRLQSIAADVELCVTLNRTEAIDPSKIIRKIDYAHPMFTRRGVAAQARLGEISGVNRTHYCGAYWGWGFHEDGVLSGLRVVDELGAAVPMPLAA
jgi:predicted NAD/FAD-binding protein